MLNLKLNELQIIICHSVAQYYPLITLLSLCLFASYLFRAVVYHSQPDWFLVYVFPKEREDNIPRNQFFLLFVPLVDEKVRN